MPSCQEEDFERFLERAGDYTSIFFKSLAKNDHQWADGHESHQSGVLVPRRFIRFFGLESAPESNFTKELDVNWLLDGHVFRRSDITYHGGYKKTRLNYYCEGNRATRPEVHLTCVYNPYFENLESGAVLLVGRRSDGSSVSYDAIIIGVEQDRLLDRAIESLGLPDSPHWGVVNLSEREFGFGNDFGPKMTRLIRNRAEELYGESESLPTTSATATSIWDIVEVADSELKGRVNCPGLHSANSPLKTVLRNAPGNLVRWLLQEAEFSLFRAIEALHYPKLLTQGLKEANSTEAPNGWGELEEYMAAALERFISVGKSITQSRRSRAGKSFEHHVEHLLDNLDLSYERESGNRRLDFAVRRPNTSSTLILSAKTSIRERWKQVPEGAYFITLDRQISESKLERMAQRGLSIVVPEEDEGELDQFQNRDSVFSFKKFFARIREL
jgi:hypothetical protein